MNGVGGLVLVLASILMVTLPRRLAILPLLLAATYMTRGQVLEIGPADFTIPRLLVVVGFLRVIARGEHLPDGLHGVDKLVLTLAAILIGMSTFHTSDAWVFRMGLVWTEVGCYFLFRIFLQDREDVQSTFMFLCVALLPLAALMVIEKVTGHNPFGGLGGVVEYSLVRDGRVRAAGPFAHPILAGTVGAMAIAMGLAVWKISRRHAWAGLFSGAGIIFAATSSGPIMTVVFIGVGLAAWRVRDRMRTVRWGILTGLIALDIVMKDPVYFLMARIDISGGSQGYYRSQLVRSSFQHLSEWWASGTDYTRHWMASGIYANDRMVDITNHFLAMGVMGGLLLMAVFIAIIVYSFRDVGRGIKQHAEASIDQQFFIWMLGALLFGFVMTFWSISLFDQSVLYFYLCLAAIQSVVRQPRAIPVALVKTSPHESPPHVRLAATRASAKTRLPGKGL